MKLSHKDILDLNFFLILNIKHSRFRAFFIVNYFLLQE